MWSLPGKLDLFDDDAGPLSGGLLLRSLPGNTSMFVCVCVCVCVCVRACGRMVGKWLFCSRPSLFTSWLLWLCCLGIGFCCGRSFFFIYLSIYLCGVLLCVCVCVCVCEFVCEFVCVCVGVCVCVCVYVCVYLL